MNITAIMWVMISLTFLMLLVGGPIALWQFQRFMTLYISKHDALMTRIEILEKRLVSSERKEPTS